jgi:hypothetical protein
LNLENYFQNSSQTLKVLNQICLFKRDISFEKFISILVLIFNMNLKQNLFMMKSSASLQISIIYWELEVRFWNFGWNSANWKFWMKLEKKYILSLLVSDSSSLSSSSTHGLASSDPTRSHATAPPVASAAGRDLLTHCHLVWGRWHMDLWPTRQWGYHASEGTWSYAHMGFPLQDIYFSPALFVVTCLLILFLNYYHYDQNSNSNMTKNIVLATII